MKSLKEILKDAEKNKVAIGHFNFSDLAGLKAIFEAAREISKSQNIIVPVMVGVSEGEREFVGTWASAALVKTMREQYDYPIYLNADHTRSLDKVEEAAMAGFDEILFDGAHLPFEENIRQTREAVKIVRAINPNIVVEGEIGYIGTSSEVMKEKPKGIELTTPEEAARFVKETGVNILAPAVGNMHGLLARTNADGTRTYAEKRLDIVRIEAIKKAVQIPLTLHGGSGTNDEDFRKAIRAGITIIHINTEIRLAWRRGVEDSLKKNPNEVAPYKILPPAVDAVKRVVSERLRLFSGE
ncbi:MAG: tagatose-bisphosphate aldolase [Candidatus Liptonbacteria bacterium RIFCSPLOWO2_01_FULL_52_25]|uniref:Tagatose-bisphosphate aldolase n=1 Tax=Candidatus Liptonbacteria bacterium RIFCSPLOWO2_01_FULL_52_25 TaxID=1798650 RepID=A0A1G2CF51_9BACT|nr:MAG: tagatose-bisphosphate aldolase [Candidatus Liptonbacteria bacterium RIFCSPLOWO2_01_FULL_52_25]